MSGKPGEGSIETLAPPDIKHPPERVTPLRVGKMTKHGAPFRPAEVRVRQKPHVGESKPCKVLRPVRAAQ